MLSLVTKTELLQELDKKVKLCYISW